MIPQIESAAGKGTAPIYQLKIVLLGTKPPIWRRLQVPGNANLGWLHAVLQVAIGWTNSHLHHFLTADARYSDPRNNEDMGFGEEPDRDEAKATLMEVAPDEGAQFGYEYDFGDSWEHEITVEKFCRRSRSGHDRALPRRRPRLSAGGLRRHLGLRGPAQDSQEPETPRAQA